ncbi:hypothetical protein BaRGS_00026762, partial [Batillaria attramentaria]
NGFTVLCIPPLSRAAEHCMESARERVERPAGKLKSILVLRLNMAASQHRG